MSESVALQPLEENTLHSRTETTHSLMALFLQARILLLYGAAGIGKTWLLRESLKPELERRRFFGEVREFRFDPTVSEYPPVPTAFDHASAPQQVNGSQAVDRQEMDDRSRPICCIYDQLEVLLENKSAEPAEWWFDRLVLSMEEKRHWVLLSLREEALPEFRRRLGNYFPSLQMFWLKGLDLEHARSLLELTLRKASEKRQQTEAALSSDGPGAEDILRRIRTPQDTVDPLQLIMAQRVILESDDPKDLLWTTGSELAQLYYEHALRQALKEWHAERMHTRLEELLVRLQLELLFIDKVSEKRIVSTAQQADGNFELPTAFLDLLARDNRLLERKTEVSGVRYALTYDRLIPAILQANRAWRDRHEPLAVPSAYWWVLNGRTPEALLRGRALRRGRTFVRLLEPYKHLRSLYKWNEILEFLDRSRRRQRVRYGLLPFVGLALCALGGGAGIYYYASFMVKATPVLQGSRPPDKDKTQALTEQDKVKEAALAEEIKLIQKTVQGIMAANQQLKEENAALRKDKIRLNFEYSKAMKKIISPEDEKLLNNCKTILDDYQDLEKSIFEMGGLGSKPSLLAPEPDADRARSSGPREDRRSGPPPAGKRPR